MIRISLALIVYVILFQTCAFFLESMAWQKPFVRRLFKTTPENASMTRVLALNQGVYNLFLAAGLIWALVAVSSLSFELKVFFLSCVVVAGLVGGFSVSKRIFILQGIPALAALMLVLLHF